MAPRANWKGFLRLSLVTCPVALYPGRSVPQEVCPVSLRRLRMPRGILTAGQKSAEGVLGYVVGKASEALHAERRSQ
jgi:hypothetical protein